MKIISKFAYLILSVAIINDNIIASDDANNLLGQTQFAIQTARNNVLQQDNGGALCSLATLNQCLCVLNPGNNEVLKNIIKEYSNLSENQKYMANPRNVLQKVLRNVKNNDSMKKDLFAQEEDVSERYSNLVSLSEKIGQDISKVIYLIALTTPNNIHEIYHEGQIAGAERKKNLMEQISKNIERKYNINIYNKLTKNSQLQYIEELIERITQSTKNISNEIILQKFDEFEQNHSKNLLNLAVNINDMETFNYFKDDIYRENLLFNNKNYELSSIALLSVSRNGNTYKGKKQGTHYIAAKKIQGKWLLIDSMHNNNIIGTFNSFKELSQKLIEKYSDAIGRWLPRMLFFTKKGNNNIQNNIQHNNYINNDNNINKIKNNSNNKQPINKKNNISKINNNNNNIENINKIKNNINSKQLLNKQNNINKMQYNNKNNKQMKNNNSDLDYVIEKSKQNTNEFKNNKKNKNKINVNNIYDDINTNNIELNNINNNSYYSNSSNDSKKSTDKSSNKSVPEQEIENISKQINDIKQQINEAQKQYNIIFNKIVNERHQSLQEDATKHITKLINDAKLLENQNSFYEYTKENKCIYLGVCYTEIIKLLSIKNYIKNELTNKLLLLQKEKDRKQKKIDMNNADVLLITLHNTILNNKDLNIQETVNFIEKEIKDSNERILFDKNTMKKYCNKRLIEINNSIKALEQKNKHLRKESDIINNAVNISNFQCDKKKIEFMSNNFGIINDWWTNRAIAESESDSENSK